LKLRKRKVDRSAASADDFRLKCTEKAPESGAPVLALGPMKTARKLKFAMAERAGVECNPASRPLVTAARLKTVQTYPFLTILNGRISILEIHHFG
jgi:hypothetical protein